MKISLHKSQLEGNLAAPPSKSYTIRGLMAAALAHGQSRLTDPLTSDDSEAAGEVLGQVGVDLSRSESSWGIRGGHLKEPVKDLFCRDSAATMRFMAAICSLVPGRCRLVPGPSLAKRPIQPMLEALGQLGVSCHAEGSAVVVDGGRLRGGTVEMTGDISSQFISALLLVSPLAEEGAVIRLTTPLASAPYIEMTLDTMNHFGIGVETSADLRQFAISPQAYRPAGYRVEGDWSSASYFLALGAAAGQISVSNLNRNSLQGDKIVLNLLKEMGARVDSNGDTVTVSRSGLMAITADLADSIDLLPTLAALAALAEGRSVLNGISRARLKESNRVAAVAEGLGRMGISVTEAEDRLTIHGGRPRGAVIDSHGDHRIAMAFSILGAAIGGTTIEGAECVAKTYPGFWQNLKKVGGRLEIDG
ncbi:MAG: 3-phosphoshikimate 1-carboxyvinyltransferase [Dehalococcoidales bacterium]